MKGRESGMPDEAYWNSFFDASGILERFRFPHRPDAKVIEFGSGYGTFTFPIAAMTRGVITALDIEPELIGLVRQRSKGTGYSNISAQLRDFVESGTRLESHSQDAAFIFNLLHIESPERLLKEALRILAPGGKLYVMHWRSDIETPRGPPLEIRPTPEQCTAWMKQAGFDTPSSVDLEDCAPYHFGLIANARAST